MALSEANTSVSDHYTIVYKTASPLVLDLPQTGLKWGN